MSSKLSTEEKEDSLRLVTCGSLAKEGNIALRADMDDLDPYSLVETSIIFTVVTLSHASIWK